MPNELYLYGDIGQTMWSDDNAIVAADVVEALADLPSSDGLDIHINSYGGDIGEGLSIMNVIRSYTNKMTVLNPEFQTRTIVDGFAYSAGTLLMLAAPTRIMQPGTKAMIHNPLSMAVGDYRRMEKEAERLKISREQTIDLYHQMTGKPKDAIGLMMDDETYLSPAEAVKLGLATEATSAAIPQKAQLSGNQKPLLAPTEPYKDVMKILSSAEKLGIGGYQKTIAMVKKKSQSMSNVPLDLLLKEVDLLELCL